ncbi:hypothetical protein KSF73_07400 [Burkholderiaceae bacterium DAT-1]|nr:hypothetical protein [Burkholderiaceae bacterium DAT-1]
MLKLPRTTVTAIILLNLLGGCAVLDPHRVVARRLDHLGQGAAPLTTETRIAAFNEVWETINERYLDPSFNGVDWKAVGERYREAALAAADDRAFWRQLDKMAGELRDSHTRVESPERYELLRKARVASIGVSINLDGDTIYLDAVRMGSEAWLKGLRPGMKVVKIDQVDATRWWTQNEADARKGSTPQTAARYINALLSASSGDSRTLTIANESGSRDIVLMRNVYDAPASISAQKLAGNIGYLRFTGFSADIRTATLEGLASLKQSKGLIIDLRGNPGGDLRFARTFVDQFFKGHRDGGQSQTRDGKPVSMLLGMITLVPEKMDIEGVDQPLEQPVVILQNSSSGSASEFTASMLQDSGRVRVVGEVSCGCLLGFLGLKPIIGGGALAYSELGFTSPKGRRIEGMGVQPDVLVRPTYAQLAAGRDPQFEAALDELNRMIAEKAEKKPS